MAGKFVQLDEAARILNVPADRLVEMVKDGQIRGFRDGASWKFAESEVKRLQDEGLDVLDDLPMGGSSILVSEQDVGSTVRRSGSVIIGGDKPQETDKSSGSDIELSADSDPEGSGLLLVPASKDGSDVRLVPANRTPGPVPQQPADDGDSVDDLLQLAPVDNKKKKDSGSAISLSEISDEDVMSKGQVRPAQIEESDGLELIDDDEISGRSGKDSGNVLSDVDLLSAQHGGSGLIRGDSSGSVLSGMKLPVMGGDSTPITDGIDGSDLAIADDDDLVLGGGGSDLAIAGDSGLNLMSPSDSGLSLEAEPLDLAGSSISALDLAVDADGSNRGGSKKGGSSGSLVDFRADEEFNLSASGVAIEAEEDSGSQVIDVEDSADAFAPVGEEAGMIEGGFGEFDAGDAINAEGGEIAVVEETLGGTDASPEMAGAMVPAYEVPFSLMSVMTLLSVFMLMCLGGMILTDMVRNMADHAGSDPQVNSLTEAFLGMLGM